MFAMLEHHKPAKDIYDDGRLFLDFSEQAASLNGNLTREYKKIESDCRKGARAQLERMKELCKERNSLYEKQNDLKGQKEKIEKSLER